MPPRCPLEHDGVRLPAQLIARRGIRHDGQLALQCLKDARCGGSRALKPANRDSAGLVG